MTPNAHQRPLTSGERPTVSHSPFKHGTTSCSHPSPPSPLASLTPNSFIQPASVNLLNNPAVFSPSGSLFEESASVSSPESLQERLVGEEQNVSSV